MFESSVDVLYDDYERIPLTWTNTYDGKLGEHINVNTMYIEIMSPLSFIRWFDIMFLPIAVGATTSQHSLPFDVAAPLCTDASCNIATAHEVLPPTSLPWSCKPSCAHDVTTSSSS
jgi:hypothetical protein